MKRRSIFLALLALTLLSAARAQVSITLIETGGTFGVDDLALTGTAFAQDVLGGGMYDEHSIAHLNDHTYGNSNSWIGDSYATYAGILLATPTTLTSFAFGRDNSGSPEPFVDRASGYYQIEYTFDSIDGFNPDTATWYSLANLDNGSLYPDAESTPWLRHLYQLDTPLNNVTGIRFVTTGGFDFGQAIDEIEIYGTSAVPEPATWAALMGVATLGVAGYRRRKKFVAQS